MKWKKNLRHPPVPVTSPDMMVHRLNGQVMSREAVMAGIRIGVYRAQDWQPVPAGIPLRQPKRS